MSLPKFFLIGASKAGTTSLHRYLDQHPQIYMSPIKEPGFLADEIRIANFDDDFRRLAEARRASLRAYLDGPSRERFSGGPIESWEDYQSLFRDAPVGAVIGESTPAYLWSPTAPGNIAARFPHAKILAILRNPVERAFAQYAHMLSFAGRHMTFREYVDAALQSQRSGNTRIGELYPFLQFGLYADQMQRYFDLFPRGQIQIHLYEDYSRAPRETLRSIFSFLGVEVSAPVDLSQRHMEAGVPRSHAAAGLLRRSGLGRSVAGALPDGLRRFARRAIYRPRTDMRIEARDRVFLANYYRDDVTRLSQLLQRDLSGWLAPGS